MAQSIDSSMKSLHNLIINYCFIKVSEKIKRSLELCQIVVADIYTHKKGDTLRIREEFVSIKMLIDTVCNYEHILIPVKEQQYCCLHSYHNNSKLKRHYLQGESKQNDSEVNFPKIS